MQTSPVPQPQRIGVPRETFPGEKRVATVPDVVEKLIKLGFTVAVESGAGDAALSTPTMARVIAGKLVVIDNGNRRMQIFNKVPDAGVNGSRADDTVGSDSEVIPAAVSAANLMLGDGGVGSFLIVADRGDARQPGIALYRIF